MVNIARGKKSLATSLAVKITNLATCVQWLCSKLHIQHLCLTNSIWCWVAIWCLSDLPLTFLLTQILFPFFLLSTSSSSSYPMIPSSHPFSLSSLFFDMNWLWYKICSRKLTIGTLHYNHTALTNAIVVSQFVHIISIWYPNIDWVLNTGNIGHWNWNLMVEKKTTTYNRVKSFTNL